MGTKFDTFKAGAKRFGKVSIEILDAMAEASIEREREMIANSGKTAVVTVSERTGFLDASFDSETTVMVAIDEPTQAECRRAARVAAETYPRFARLKVRAEVRNAHGLVASFAGETYDSGKTWF